MKKSLLTLLLLGALSACSQSDDAKKNTQQPSSLTTQSASHSDDTGILNYKEKLDIAKIGLALQEAGFHEIAKSNKEAEWNQRLANAKTNEDVQSVLREQLAIYRKGAEHLAKMQMESTQGKIVHAKLLSGLIGVQRVLEQMTNMNLVSPKDVVKVNELTSRAKLHTQDLMQGMQLWMEMMKNNGFNPDEQTESQFKEKIKELEQKIR